LSHIHRELKKLLITKEELVTDLTNIMYCHTDAVEKLTKIKADSDKQLVESMQQIKDLAADRDLKAKKLADWRRQRRQLLTWWRKVKRATRIWWSIFVKLPRRPRRRRHHASRKRVEGGVKAAWRLTRVGDEEEHRRRRKRTDGRPPPIVSPPGGRTGGRGERSALCG
jgi:hypothetical protein